MVSSLFQQGELFASKMETYVEITRSNLVARLVASGMTLMSRGHGQVLSFDPTGLCRDMDLDESDHQVDAIVYLYHLFALTIVLFCWLG